MADEARLHEILDIYEQALAEGDRETANQALSMYHVESHEQQQAPPAAAPAKPQSPFENPVTVGLDAAASMVSGAFGYTAGGLAGLAASPFGNDVAENVREKTQSMLTHEPVTRGAQEALGVVSKPFEWLHESGKALADRSQDSGFELPGLDKDETAATVQTVVEGVPQALLSMFGAPEAGVVKPKPVRAAPTAEGQLLQSKGIDLKRSQMGSEIAKSMDRGSDAVLGESSFDVKQAADYNRAVMEEAGGHVSSEGKITPSQLKDLKDDIGRDYNDLHQRVQTYVDTQLDADLQQVAYEASAELSPDQMARIDNQIKQIRSKGAAGFIDGRAAQNIRTTLGRMGQAPDPSLAHWARQLQEKLDDAFERSASPADKAKMKRTRARFRMQMQLDRAMQGNASGYVSPNKLYSVVDRPTNRSAGLHDLARAGKDVLPDSVANSGTPTRHADLGKLITMVNPNKWGDLARTVGAAFGGRFLNESPNMGARAAAGARELGPTAAVSSGASMLEEQDRRTREYLKAIGAL